MRDRPKQQFTRGRAMNSFRATALATVVGLAVCSAASTARADDAPWAVRVLAGGLETQNLANSTGGFLSVGLERRITDVIAIECAVATPRHAQTDNFDQFNFTPLTLMAKFYIPATGRFRPYVGIGLNGTFISVPGNSQVTVGGAIEAGFDLKVSGQTSFTFDVKWMNASGNVVLSGCGDGCPGVYSSNTSFDPLYVGVGVVQRF